MKTMFLQSAHQGTKLQNSSKTGPDSSLQKISTYGPHWAYRSTISDSVPGTAIGSRCDNSVDAKWSLVTKRVRATKKVRAMVTQGLG